MKSPKELVLEIASNKKDTCFDLNRCFIYKGVLYEECNMRSGRVSHRFRVVFSYDDYDYVEDMNLIQELTKVRG
jgi:hypothetical protein